MVAPADTENLVVKAVGLTKVFKDFWGRPKARALNGVDLNIRRGEVFGLLGPNGSGKSTTVKLLLGLLYPTRGTLTVFDQSPRNVYIKRRIGYLPEESYLYRYLTATETLDFFGALFDIPPTERRQRTDQLLEMVGLGNARNRPVGEFSKGMARRIGLAQALVNDPSLVILDEPTAGLDPIGCREVKDLIRLLAARGKTVILCTHLLADVEDVCDEVVVLYGGRIRTQGTLEEILTVEDQTRIVSPRLNPETLAAVTELIRRHTGDTALQIDQPKMTLEDFFLNVVRAAREASVETAGVQSGGEIAEYLRGDAQDGTEDDRSRRVLAALEKSQVADVAPEPDRDEAALPTAAPEPALDSRKLEALAHAKTAVPAVETRDDAEASAERDDANRRLHDLLGPQTLNAEKPREDA